jgi:[lysine-biosynthesis-protein LysW]--L-2-aminoadipate ligase
MRFALVSVRMTATNEGLAAARHEHGRWEPMTPDEALDALRPGDVALGRLDVLPTLDGVDDGLWALGALAARDVVVLNAPGALLAAHDKLLTARLLRRHGIPHPATRHVRPGRPLPVVDSPVVVKPRFGSWGRDVHRCDGTESLRATVALVRDRGWFCRDGALVPELVEPQGYDLRVLVAGGRVAGAAFRVAAQGEWRTNVALGGARRPVADVPHEAGMVALAAARAVGADLVGVDLLPDGTGGWVVLEVNGAVEFSPEYAVGCNVFADVASLLARVAVRRLAAPPAELPLAGA